MSRKMFATVGVMLVVLIVVLALLMGIEKGTVLFQGVGALLLFVALGMFFVNKGEK